MRQQFIAVLRRFTALRLCTEPQLSIIPLLLRIGRLRSSIAVHQSIALLQLFTEALDPAPRFIATP